MEADSLTSCTLGYCRRRPRLFCYLYTGERDWIVPCEPEFLAFSERRSKEGKRFEKPSSQNLGEWISSAVTRWTVMVHRPSRGRGKKRKWSPGHGPGFDSHSLNQASSKGADSRLILQHSSHSTKKKLLMRPPTKPLPPDLVSDISTSTSKLDLLFGVLELLTWGLQTFSSHCARIDQGFIYERNNRSGPDCN
ncbi:hypothetical protein C8J55DRAFT_487590 [Lentinula edodes]|uniref:Uncharacterized protein n=1 Tax=Lentinula lateritia TaxID=40482 RepID=A0A9W9AP87_9AGAR|nr:hypothetical protein C8J55DRAFT_487590 [Lentinula edodes]